MQTGGLILILVGVVVVYGAVTGKLDIFLTALNTAYQHGNETGGAAATPASLTVPQIQSPILPSFKTPTFTQQGAKEIFI